MSKHPFLITQACLIAWKYSSVRKGKMNVQLFSFNFQSKELEQRHNWWGREAFSFFIECHNEFIVLVFGGGCFMSHSRIPSRNRFISVLFSTLLTYSFSFICIVIWNNFISFNWSALCFMFSIYYALIINPLGLGI